jgi:hypothetical protein
MEFRSSAWVHRFHSLSYGSLHMCFLRCRLCSVIWALRFLPWKKALFGSVQRAIVGFELGGDMTLPGLPRNLAAHFARLRVNLDFFAIHNYVVRYRGQWKLVFLSGNCQFHESFVGITSRALIPRSGPFSGPRRRCARSFLCAPSHLRPW